MKINPNSPDFQTNLDATKPAESGKAFAEKLISKASLNTASLNNPSLAAAIEGLSKQDLADPAKANAAVVRAVQGMMQREFPAMSAPERDQVTGWLSRDPILRDALLKQLMSVAS
jgi:hypothetical protein